jgi:hypothetical protein
MFSRRNQLWWLIILSAITALAQYVVQGAMASGHNPAQFPMWFWYMDFGLWGARALIEAWVIVYLFTTQASTRMQRIAITLFEISLITLITPTIGFALRGLGYGLETREMLAEPYLTWWYMGIGAYTSLMMGAAGYAFKAQPHGEDMQVVDAGTLQEVAGLRDDLSRVQSEVEAARAAVASVSAFAALPPAIQVRWIAENRNGSTPTNNELSRIFDVHPSTISRWISGGE